MEAVRGLRQFKFLERKKPNQIVQKNTQKRENCQLSKDSRRVNIVKIRGESQHFSDLSPIFLAPTLLTPEQTCPDDRRGVDSCSSVQGLIWDHVCYE